MQKLKDYFDNTTLHGFSYISRGSHYVEKIFWILAIFSSFVCCSLIFHQLYSKYDSNQVIIYQKDTAVHISKIPFPSVSICAYSMVNYSYDIFSSLLKNHTYSYFKITKPTANLNWKNPQAYIQFEIDKLSFWINKYKLGGQMVISHLGWCNSFNLVEFSKMFHENSTANYFDIFYRKGFIRRGKKFFQNMTEVPPFYTPRKEFGFVFGFVVRVNYFVGEESGMKYWMDRNWQVKVIVHSPFEMPDARHKSFVANYQEIFKLLIGVKISITDGTLLDLDVENRRCYKPDERQLQYFKTYTSINCLRECESSFILQKCGCVPYYFINNDTSLICSTTQLECFRREYEEFEEVKCRCYPPCEDVGYEITTQRIVTTYPLLELAPEQNTKITANFIDDSFYPQIKRKYFTMIDWFSFVGGILGLFFGFSFLSAFEIVFHVWMMILRLKREQLLGAANMAGAWRKIQEYLRSYLKSSSIHSFSYVSDSKLKIYERLAWIISFILSITTCIYMIIELRQRLTIDSASISMDDKLFNVSQLTFPAVTVVAEPGENTQAEWLKEIGLKFEMSKMRENFRIEYVQMRDIVDSLINRKYAFAIKSAQTVFPRNITNYGHKIASTIKKHYFPFRFLTMSWNRQYFVPKAEILTSYGVGKVFNIVEFKDLLNIDRVSQDFSYDYNGYFNDSEQLYLIDWEYNWYWDWKTQNLKLPWKAVYSKNELVTVFSFHARSPLFMFLHSPYEHPIHIDMDSNYVFEMYKQRTIEVWITPNIVTSSDDFMKLPLTTRMCFLENERKLKFFKVYTQQNCEIECLSAKLLESCGCIPYDVIRSNDTKVCELFDYICIDETKDKFYTQTNEDNQCNCLQPCSFIKYNYEFVELSSDANIVELRFKGSEFASMKRVRQFTIFDFLSYIGGLLGLFAGISVLSIFEIFYFFTLRLICEIFRVKKSRKKVRYVQDVSIVGPRVVD